MTRSEDIARRSVTPDPPIKLREQLALLMPVVAASMNAIPITRKDEK